MKQTFKILIAVILYSLNSFGQNQMKLNKLDFSSIPIGIKYKGKIKNAVRWTDKSGDNIVILTETGEFLSKSSDDEDLRNAELYAYHFFSIGNSIKQTWRIYDFIKDCPVDIEAEFIRDTFQVTDLNNDGTGEIWIMYKTACHGDVSPFDMKIIMYQGKQKFAMRGQNKVQVSEKEFYGGDYKFDSAFSNGPPAFINFAKILWSKNIMQIRGDTANTTSRM